MNIEFLLESTTIGDLKQNTEIKKSFWRAPVLLVEYYIRKRLTKKFVNKFADDLIKYPDIKTVFVTLLNMSISDDECFLFLPFENDIPKEVRETTEPQQIMTLAESYMTERMQMILKDPLLMRSFIMQNIYSTMGYIPTANAPFILLESKHLPHLMAIKNNMNNIIGGTIFYGVALLTTIIITLIKFL